MNHLPSQPILKGNSRNDIHLCSFTSNLPAFTAYMAKPCVVPLFPLEQRWIQNSSSLSFLAHNIHLANKCLLSTVVVPKAYQQS